MSGCPEVLRRDVKPVVDLSELYPDDLNGKWEGKLTSDEREWWDQVSAIFISDGRMPSVTGIMGSYTKNFPTGENEPTESSLRRAIHRVAKKAGVTLERR